MDTLHYSLSKLTAITLLILLFLTEPNIYLKALLLFNIGLAGYTIYLTGETVNNNTRENRGKQSKFGFYSDGLLVGITGTILAVKLHTESLQTV